MILFAALLLTACDESDETDAATAPCQEETRSTELSPGVTFDGQAATLEVVSLDPGQPVAGDNMWEISLSANGAALEGCALSGSIDMPDHGHGGPAPQFAEPNAGVYEMETTLTMGGYWEIDVDLDCPGLDSVDAIMLPICAE